MFASFVSQVPFLDTIYRIYFYMIIAYILMSWVPNARGSAIGQLLGRFVEPYVGFFRKFIPPIGGVLDLSPIVAIFCLQFIFYGIDAVLATVFQL